MNFSISLELIFALLVQFVIFVSIFASLRERVKRLEDDRKEMQDQIVTFQEKHELIARIDAKLDLLISQLKQN